MNKFNRDLLVLFKEELMNPQAIEHEVEMLHELLYSVEKAENLVVAYEVIDLNNYKINAEEKAVRKTISTRELRPFVFLNNKN
ncbi:MAG TPA: hypothetical protein VG847_11145 [Chitinophagaceae bacterium]|nr:hypothetical protein [Chitinophagaceae bacterium]